eukprot:11812793-Karenia_brevis.AAC.1
MGVATKGSSPGLATKLAATGLEINNHPSGMATKLLAESLEAEESNEPLDESSRRVKLSSPERTGRAQASEDLTHLPDYDNRAASPLNTAREFASLKSELSLVALGN